MKTPHEAIIRERAHQLASFLATCGIQTSINEESWRDYHVKLDLISNGTKVGRSSLYYAPSKKTFSIVTSEVTSSEVIEILKREFQKLERTPTKSTAPATKIPNGWVAYVDGSYLHGRIGYGAVVLHDGVQKAELFGRVHENHESRQVAGELLATTQVIEWCQQNNVGEVTILYDYAGIEMWAKGRWKANLPLTQNYAAFFKDLTTKVLFKKVQSHSGDTWNDVADALARKGAKGSS